jgi:hypothetical protein
MTDELLFPNVKVYQACNLIQKKLSEGVKLEMNNFPIVKIKSKITDTSYIITLTYEEDGNTFDDKFVLADNNDETLRFYEMLGNIRVK